MKDFFYRYRGYIYFLVFLGILFFIIFPFFNKINRERRLSIFERGVYSIGRVTDYREETESWHYRYEFNYRGKKYKSRSYYKGIDLEVGKNYFLLIDPKYPNFNNFLLQPFLVPDSITEAPPEGWKEPSVPIDKEKIRKFLENY